MTLAIISDIEKLMPLLTGSAGALIISCIANWYQAKEKKVLQDIIKGKDEDLKGLTKESIAGIATLAGLNQANQHWQDQITRTLEEIKSSLPE